MVSEPLVLVIKLADRLHNMRTVFALKKDKQKAVATETLQVWCGLAERLGMMALKVCSACDWHVQLMTEQTDCWVQCTEKRSAVRVCLKFKGSPHQQELHFSARFCAQLFLLFLLFMAFKVCSASADSLGCHML